MSRCDLSFGRGINCYNNVAGIKAIYIVPFDSLPYDELFINEDELINIGGLSPRIYKYEVQNTTNSFDETNNSDESTGTVSWDGSLDLTLVKQNNLYQAELKKLPNTRSKIIVEFNGGYKRLMGIENGCSFALNTQSGGLLNDFNGYALDISSLEQYPAPFIYESLEDMGFEIVDDEPIETQPNAFISRWRTTNSNEKITLPYINQGIYDGTIDWGDGTITDNSFADRTHIYDEPGFYTITISGVIRGFKFNLLSIHSMSPKIYEILQWGTLDLTHHLTVGGYFKGCTNLDCKLVTDVLSIIPTNLESMFEGCNSLTNVRYLNVWDLSNVTTISKMFKSAFSFNQRIDYWNVSNVTDFSETFRFATLFNQEINKWDVSNGTDFSRMFLNAESYNQKLNDWDVSNGIDFSRMFESTPFNQRLDNWVFNSSNPINLSSMFKNNIIYNQPITWDTSRVSNMAEMFYGSIGFNQDISNLNYDSLVGDNALKDFMKGKSMADYFCIYYSNLLSTWRNSTIPINQLSVDMGTIGYDIFAQGDRDFLTNSRGWTIIDGGQCVDNSLTLEYYLSSSNLNITLPLEEFGTYNGFISWGDGTLSSASYANRNHTYSSPGIYEVRISGDIYGISFSGVQDKLSITDVKQWGINTHLGHLNNNFRGLINLDITAIDVPFVSHLSGVFYNCPSLVNANGSIGNWDVSNVTNLRNSFAKCTLFNVDLSSWDVSNVKDSSGMFLDCINFNQPLLSWDMSNNNNLNHMFYGATTFNQILKPWDVSNVKYMRALFGYATAYDEAINSWDFSSIEDISDFMIGKTHNDYTANFYDQLLIKWNSLNIYNMLGVNMGTIKRTSMSILPFANLTTVKGWEITDGGL